MKLNGEKITPEALKSEVETRLNDTDVGANILQAQMKTDTEGFVVESVIVNVRSMVWIASRKVIGTEVRKKCHKMLEFLSQFESNA